MIQNVLQIILPGTTSTEDLAPTVNVADSVKVAAQNIAQEMMTDPSGFVEKIIQELIQFGFKVLGALAIYLIGIWVIKRIKKTLNAVMVKRNTEKTLASFITSLLSLLLTIVLIMLTIGALGLNTTSIAAMLGAGAMAVGMALSGTMENFAGGLIILLFKPFKSGDFISVDGYSGYVNEVSIFNTKITTTDNRVVIIPNGTTSNGTIDNYSINGVRRLEWKVGIEYGDNAQDCIDAMIEIAKSDNRILGSSTNSCTDPYAVLASLDDSSVCIMLRAWVKSEDYWQVYYDLNLRLYQELPLKGFSFAFPHMDVNIRN